MDNNPPYERILVESDILIFPDLRLDYGFVSDFRLAVDDPVFSVYLLSDESPVVVDRDTEVTLSVSDEDSKNY